MTLYLEITLIYRGVYDLNNVKFYDSNDVSYDLRNNFVMTKEFELLGDGLDTLSDNVILSKGTSEEEQPLPIINLLSKSFFRLLENDEMVLHPEKNPDIFTMREVFLKAARDLESIINTQKYGEPTLGDGLDLLPTTKLHDDYSSMFGYQLNSHRRNDERNDEFFLKIAAIKTATMEGKQSFEEEHNKLLELFLNRGEEKGYLNFTTELMVLFMILASYGNHKRVINKHFASLYEKHEKYCERTLNVHRNIWAYVQKKRALQLSITPNYFTVGSTEIAGKSMPLSKVKIAFAAYPKDILQMAWAELIFAQIHEMPVGLCTFCGTVYRVGGKKGRGNHRQSTCGNPECQKKLRYQRDQEKKQQDPEEVRRKNRERQKKYQDKQKALRLHNEGVAINEIAKTIDRSVEEIREWLRSH